MLREEKRSTVQVTLCLPQIQNRPAGYSPGLHGEGTATNGLSDGTAYV